MQPRGSMRGFGLTCPYCGGAVWRKKICIEIITATS